MYYNIVNKEPRLINVAWWSGDGHGMVEEEKVRLEREGKGEEGERDTHREKRESDGKEKEGEQRGGWGEDEIRVSSQFTCTCTSSDKLQANPLPHYRNVLLTLFNMYIHVDACTTCACYAVPLP